MKRKILSYITAFSLIITVFAGVKLPSSAAEIYVSADYEYTVDYKNEVTLKTYVGESREVIVPSEIDGMPVTVISAYCFNGERIRNDEGSGFINHPNRKRNNRIRKVVIPESVEKIEEYAFAEMENLRQLVFSEGLKTVEPFAFAYCPELRKISFPESLVEFNLLALEKTPVEEIVLGPNVKKLIFEDVEASYVKRIVCNAQDAYFERVYLSENSVLGEVVFNGRFGGGYIEKSPIKRIVCNGGTNYYSVLEAGTCGFRYCADENGDNVVLSKLDSDIIKTLESDGCKYYINERNEAVITRYIGRKRDVIVPSSLGGHTVTAIAPLAFSSLESFGADFSAGNDWYIDIGQLVCVTLPDTVKSIGDYAFAYNISLEKINIPEGVEKISAECFYGCSSLENISLPETVREIENAAFEHCEGLESIDMMGAEKVGDRAFHLCSSLKQADYSEKLKEIGVMAFSRSVLADTLDLSSVDKIGAGAFSSTKIRKAVLNDNLETLENGVFQGCNLLEEVNYPSKLVSVGECCFRLTAVTQAVFSEGLKEIGALAFDSCKKLSVITFPESIKKIGSFAFEYTLIEVLVIPENLSVIGYRAFGDCKSLETLYFNAKNCTVEPYMNQNQDFDVENLQETSPFYGCNIKEVILGEGVTSIGSQTGIFGTFEDCDGLKHIMIPDSVSQIGAAAFRNCSSLETAVIPGSVTHIADDAFDGCGKLTIICFENSYVHNYAQAHGIKVGTFVVAPIPNQTYTGKKITPDVTVTFLGDSLDKNVDFSVSYANNINVGEADVTVKGKGDYKNFSNGVKFTIVTRSITYAAILPIADQPWTGSSVIPVLTVTDGTNLLKEGRDYAAVYSDNKNEGTANVRIMGKGNYSGSISAEFKIVKMSDGQSFFSRLVSAVSSLFARLSVIIRGIFN